ncbi:hypothetical protein [Rhizobium halophilum]|uniref:hypothetical protein n=1 Tax=Rhizobium halophilum TaxID=2846852 RepID=UPI001EFCB3C2|nr:hypothetical protein [Rhizobium halophilum]MCF6371052.1 hypothetical protein [Rhizobium halophilum]
MALPNDIQTLVDTLVPEIRRAFIEAIQAITSQAQLTTVEGHLREGNIEAAIAALKIDPLFFRPLDRAITEAYYRGGVAALAALPKIPDPFGVAQRFLASMEDMTEPLNGQSNTSED